MSRIHEPIVKMGVFEYVSVAFHEKEWSTWSRRCIFCTKSKYVFLQESAQEVVQSSVHLPAESE